MIIAVGPGEIKSIWVELELRYGANTSIKKFILIYIWIFRIHISMWMQN